MIAIGAYVRNMCELNFVFLADCIVLYHISLYTKLLLGFRKKSMYLLMKHNRQQRVLEVMKTVS